MKKLLLAALLVCVAARLQAAEWMTDVPKALAKAKAENKIVLLEFTSLDSCIPCMQLRTNVFTTKAFEDYADKHLVLVELDFPQRKKQPKDLADANAALATEFKIDVFPTIVLLDADRKELKDITGYTMGTPADYIAMLEVKGK